MVQSVYGPCGIAVDSGGSVYVANELGLIFKFVPGSNPAVNGDKVATFSLDAGACSAAAGIGPTAGSIFVARPMLLEAPRSVA